MMMDGGDSQVVAGDDLCNSGGHVVKGKGEGGEDVIKIRIWVKLG